MCRPVLMLFWALWDPLAEEGQTGSVHLSWEKCTDCLVCRRGKSLLFLWVVGPALEMELWALVPVLQEPPSLSIV